MKTQLLLMSSNLNTFEEVNTVLPQCLSTARHLPGWLVSTTTRRNRVYPQGNLVSGEALRHHEQKKRLKKGEIRRTAVTPYNNKYLVEWQREFAEKLNAGHNIVVASVTSTGKTWIANLAVAHEILERDDVTGMIISPNSEVMRDTVKDIEHWHVKKYQYSGQMLSTMTRNYQNYDISRNGPPGQLLVISVENVVEFITDPINQGFIEKLKIIVFDEVHLSSVADALWWAQYVPHTAQLVLLSATLGNPEEVQEMVNAMQAYDPRRPQTTHIMIRKVRPIPLQLVMFKGCDMPKNGVISKELKGAKRLSCAINPNDLTTRDLKSLLGTEAVIPEDRDQQYSLGQSLKDDPVYMSQIKEKNTKALEDIITEPTHENIYKLISYLFVNDMAPVLVFNTTTEQTKTMVESIMAFITQIESEDPEYRNAYNIFNSYNTAKRRSRDDDVSKQAGGKKKNRAMNDWNKPIPDEQMPKGVNLYDVEKTLTKWRFPNDFKFDKSNARNVDQWILDCLDYGIGVYVNTMPTYMRHKIFDAVRAGSIKVLFSDSSISVGINLPIRTVVLCGSIPHHLYKQAGGRAGRRGLDDRGYIIHMMPESLIKDYICRDRIEVSIKMPKRMPFTGLTRLQVPYNLQQLIAPDLKGIYNPKEQRKLLVNVFNPNTTAEPIHPYCQLILQNYIKNLSASEKARCNFQIQLIKSEQWNYHRLTNFIKSIPYDASIMFIRLMVTGLMSKMSVKDIYQVISLLFNRIEQQDTTDDENYYLPDFSESDIPNLMEILQADADKYHIDIDFSKPIHRYIMDFCYKGKHHLEFLQELEDLGEWLYLIKTGVKRCAPLEQKNGYSDKTSELIYKIDSVYLSACTRKKVNILA